MGTKQTVRLGPFLGGLNNATGVADVIRDDELSTCIDFDFTVDGTLVTRPPIAVEAPPGGTASDKEFKIIGCFSLGGVNWTLAWNTDTFLYHRNVPSTYVTNTPWTKFSGLGAFNHVVGLSQQYNNVLYFATDAGVYSYVGTTTATLVNATVTGSSLTLFKERMVGYSSGTSRLYLSNAGDPTTWVTGTNFVDVAPGDGQNIQYVLATNAGIFIFKDDSTYVYNYDSNPALGTVQRVSNTIGAGSNMTVTQYQNDIYVFHDRNVYLLNGFSYERVSDKINADEEITGGTAATSFLSTVGDRLVLSFRTNCFVYYPRNRAWTQWALPAIKKWFYIPQSADSVGSPVYITTTYGAPVVGTGSIIMMFDDLWQVNRPVDLSNDDPTIITKMYSFDSPEVFKRLFWWGADIVASSSSGVTQVELGAVPYNFSGVRTWDDVAAYTWDGIEAYVSWDTAFSAATAAVFTTYTVSAAERKYIKANRAMRFPRIQFKVRFPGYDHTARSSINNLIMEIGMRQNPVARSEGTTT